MSGKFKLISIYSVIVICLLASRLRSLQALYHGSLCSLCSPCSLSLPVLLTQNEGEFKSAPKLASTVDSVPLQGVSNLEYSARHSGHKKNFSGFSQESRVSGRLSSYLRL